MRVCRLGVRRCWMKLRSNTSLVAVFARTNICGRAVHGGSARVGSRARKPDQANRKGVAVSKIVLLVARGECLKMLGLVISRYE